MKRKWIGRVSMAGLLCVVIGLLCAPLFLAGHNDLPDAGEVAEPEESLAPGGEWSGRSGIPDAGLEGLEWGGDSGDGRIPIGFAETSANPAETARLKRQSRIREYENSPARGTPECEQIRRLLEQEGVGVEAVGEAYQAAWEYSSHRRLVESAPEIQRSSLEFLRRMFRDSATYRIGMKYGITNEAFFEALFAIEPKVLFGSQTLSIGPEGVAGRGEGKEGNEL